MGAFSSQKAVLGVGRVDMAKVIEDVKQTFEIKGYVVEGEALSSGGAHISLTNTNIFKAVLGLKTALNVELSPQGDNWHVKTDVGIFGQQVIPTAIMLFFAWPVLVTQIWGLIKQSKLDDEVMAAIEVSLQRNRQACDRVNALPGNVGGTFCPQCGASAQFGSKFCPQCGAKL